LGIGVRDVQAVVCWCGSRSDGSGLLRMLKRQSLCREEVVAEFVGHGWDVLEMYVCK